MPSFKGKKEDCNSSFANVGNRIRHKKKSGHLPQRRKASIVSEFDVSKG